MSENEKISCSFCGRNKQDTNILIAGNSAHICDTCILQAHAIAIEDSVSKKTLSEDFKLLKPKAIKDWKLCVNMAKRKFKISPATYITLRGPLLKTAQRAYCALGY